VLARSLSSSKLGACSSSLLVDRTHLFILSHGLAWLMTVILSQIDV
jgi:hypothetical protein